jgi:O-Antigen ligase
MPADARPPTASATTAGGKALLHDPVKPAPSAGAGMHKHIIVPIVVTGVAAAVLALGWDSGGYGLAVRSGAGVAAWLAVLAASSVLPHTLRRLGGRAGLACLLLVAFAAETGVSAAWGDSAELAVNELGRVVLLLGALVLVLLLARREWLSRWCDGLAAGTVGIGLLALGSRLFPDVIHGLPPLSFLGGVQTRLAYPLGYWTGLGVVVALAFPLLLRLAAEQDTTIVVRGLAVGVIPSLAAVLYLTSARLAVVVAAVGVGLYLALSQRRWAITGAALAAASGSTVAVFALRARPDLVSGPFRTPSAISDGRQVALVILAASVVAGAAYAVATLYAPGPPRIPLRVTRAALLAGAAAAAAGVALAHPVAKFDAFRSTPPGLEQAPVGQHLLSTSSNGRWQLWTSAAREFLHHPWFGHGAGSFEAWWSQHGSGDFFARNAHSLFLEELGGLGIIGLVLLVGFFAVPFVAAAQEARRGGATREPVAAATATLVAYLVAAALDWMWEMTVVTLVAIVCAGLLLRAEKIPRHRRHGQPVRVLATTTAALAAVGALALEGILVFATHELDRSHAAAAVGDLASAQSAARTAARLEPWATTPLLQLALVDEQGGNIGGAQVEIARALKRDRANWQLWYVAARIERKLGERERSRRSLERAASLNPRSPLVSPAAQGRR